MYYNKKSEFGYLNNKGRDGTGQQIQAHVGFRMSGKNSGSYLVGYGTHVTQQYMVLLSEPLPNILLTELLEVTFSVYIYQIMANTQKINLNKAHSNTPCQIIFCGYQQENVRFSYS